MPRALSRNPLRNSSCHTTPTRDSSLEIPRPTREFPARTYEPHWPQPPTSALDGTRDGLKERKDYADRVRTKYRNISPRLAAYIVDLGEKCHNLLKGKYKSTNNKKEELAAIQVNDGMLQSRWKAEESPQGLRQKILGAVDAFTEQRMTTEYGDYLAVTLDGYRGPALAWTGFSWTDVAKELEKEEEALRAYETSIPKPTHKPSAPFHKECRSVAYEKKIMEAQVIYEIKEYAKRNQHCHSGLRNVIETANWARLAEMTIRDKRRLRQIYRQNPIGQQGMYDCITQIQREFFDTVFLSDDGTINFVASAKANEKTMRRAHQLQRRAGAQWP